MNILIDSSCYVVTCHGMLFLTSDLHVIAQAGDIYASVTHEGHGITLISSPNYHLPHMNNAKPIRYVVL